MRYEAIVQISSADPRFEDVHWEELPRVPLAQSRRKALRLFDELLGKRLVAEKLAEAKGDTTVTTVIRPTVMGFITYKLNAPATEFLMYDSKLRVGVFRD